MNPIAPLWFVFLATMAYLFERETHWFSRFNVFTVFVVGMLLRYGIAVPFSDDVNARLTGITVSQPQLVEYYVAVTLAWIVVFATVVSMRRLISRPRIASFLEFRAARRPGWTSTRAAVVVAVTLTVVVAVVWIVIPWNLFSQGFDKLLAVGHTTTGYSQQRYDYAAVTIYARSALNYAASFARFALMPAAVLILFLQRTRSKAVMVALAAAVLVLAIVGLFSGEKSAALLLALSFAVALNVANGSHSIFTWRLGLVALVLIAVVIPLLYHFQYPTANYLQNLANTLNRETVEYSRTTQLRFVFYPDLHPFLLGLGSFGVRTILHFAHITTGDAEQPETYIPTHSPGNAGYQSTWNGGFFGEGWANFGWAGVIVTSIVVGLVLLGIERWFQAGPRGPLQLGTYAAVCVASLAITDVSLPTALWTYGVLTSFAVYWVLRLFPADPPLENVVITGDVAVGPDRKDTSRGSP